ncbi:MAG: hypothetical protein LBL84_03740 [Candidatus Nomurabacteria bacterium]|jgi:hypothetical protein|nr:hypothetical protein [Candidatus Nomurabacteria bacterium]
MDTVLEKKDMLGGFGHPHSLQVVYQEMNYEADTVTITLPGVQNSGTWLFWPHLESLHQRGDYHPADVVLMDYWGWFSLVAVANELANKLQQVSSWYQTIYLDGVSFGAKVFTHVITTLRARGREDILSKIVFNAINPVIEPSNVLGKTFAAAKWLPYWLNPVLTLVLRRGHAAAWPKEAKSYGMLDDAVIIELNRDANMRIGWSLLKDQVRAMATELPELYKPIDIRCNVVLSSYDDVIDGVSAYQSLLKLFGAVDSVVLPTGHSTLAYEPEVWRKFYAVR